MKRLWYSCLLGIFSALFGVQFAWAFEVAPSATDVFVTAEDLDKGVQISVTPAEGDAANYRVSLSEVQFAPDGTLTFLPPSADVDRLIDVFPREFAGEVGKATQVRAVFAEDAALLVGKTVAIVVEEADTGESVARGAATLLFFRGTAGDAQVVPLLVTGSRFIARGVWQGSVVLKNVGSDVAVPDGDAIVTRPWSPRRVLARAAVNPGARRVPVGVQREFSLAFSDLPAGPVVVRVQTPSGSQALSVWNGFGSLIFTLFFFFGFGILCLRLFFHAAPRKTHL